MNDNKCQIYLYQCPETIACHIYIYAYIHVYIYAYIAYKTTKYHHRKSSVVFFNRYGAGESQKSLHFFAISTGFAAADLAELDLRKAGHRSGGAGSDCLERLGALIKEVLSGCVNVYINIYIYTYVNVSAYVYAYVYVHVSVVPHKAVGEVSK